MEPGRDSAQAGVFRARYRRILRFAGVHLARTWWFELFLPRIGLGGIAAHSRSRRMRRIAREYHALAVDLDGLMIKVGQFLSSRLDVLPPEITDELKDLQDEVPPVPFAELAAVAEAELLMPLTTAFASVDPVPVAAASLGQAHRARLHPDDAAETGLDGVIVKIQRPGIDGIVATDLAALRRVAGWLTRVRIVASRVDAPALVEEFATTSMEEVDYLHEAANAERFAADFADHPRVAVPEIVWERTTRRVLTLEDVTAIKIDDVEALRAAGIDPAEVAATFAAVMFDQLFTHGFFHADPHPGNVFVTPTDSETRPTRPPSAPGTQSTQPLNAPGARPTRPPSERGTPSARPLSAPGAQSTRPLSEPGGRDEAPWRLTFIDFGMMGEIAPSLRDGLRRVLFAVAARDGKALVEAIREVGLLLPTADTAELERAMTHLFARFGGMGFAELRGVDPREFRVFADEFGHVVRSLPFQLPDDFLLIIRAASLTSGVCSALDPAFNLWEAIEPYAAQLLREERGSVKDEATRQAVTFAKTVWRLPGRVDGVITRIESGDLTVDMSRIERKIALVERLARGVISAVLFTGLLLSGAILRDMAAPLGIGLMIASVFPLTHALVVSVFHSGRR